MTRLDLDEHEGWLVVRRRRPRRAGGEDGAVTACSATAGGGSASCRSGCGAVLWTAARWLFVITYLLCTAVLPSSPRWRLMSNAVSGRAREKLWLWQPQIRSLRP